MGRWKLTMIWQDGWMPAEYFVDVSKFSAHGVRGVYTSYGIECGMGYFDFAHMVKMEKIA